MATTKTTTIKGAIVGELQNLSRGYFQAFCHQLCDRAQQPRVCSAEVEDRSRRQVADLLVSRFTEQQAAAVAAETLRLIGCNQEAKTLEEKTKASLDVNFRKRPCGELESEPSQEAVDHVAAGQPLQAAKRRGSVKPPEEVEAKAKTRVLSDGGDPGNRRLVLGRFVIQFGKYKGRDFRWLLQNDVDYVAYLVAAHQEEREEQGHASVQSPLMANKESLMEFALAFPEVLREVERKHESQGSLQSDKVVGFGKYATEKLKDLYESKDEEKIGYVNYLRKKEATCSRGSKMEAAIKYILQRDKRKAAAATRRRSSRKRVQTSRSRSYGASGSTKQRKMS